MNVQLFVWFTQSTLGSYVLVVNSTSAGQEDLHGSMFDPHHIGIPSQLL
jgi:hypothetical protein